MSTHESAKVRKMRMPDLEQVLNIEREVFFSSWSRAFFQDEIDSVSSIQLVVEVHGDIAGYICAKIFSDEVHITNIAVVPGMRRQKLGSMLLSRCIDKGLELGAKWFILEVRESNTVAKEFYRRFGFRELGIRIGYYEDTGESAVLMAWGRTDECKSDRTIPVFEEPNTKDCS
ncbi:MAG: ribosomal protein S18-alanine N-acetyltransferase [Actinomycetota bacterium]|nr:ribosomal protein S18-alanine N-acetyltransferase [Actinomycetota bacterium]